MNIFISYSVDDIDMVRQIATTLKPYATVRCWEQSKEPGKEVWPMIYGWIDSADLVVALVTGKTVVRALAVGQEIGRAQAKQKWILPLVADDVPPAELGFLNGVTYEPIARDNPGPALERLQKTVAAFCKERKSQGDLLLILLGALAVIWLVSRKK